MGLHAEAKRRIEGGPEKRISNETALYHSAAANFFAADSDIYLPMPGRLAGRGNRNIQMNAFAFD